MLDVVCHFSRYWRVTVASISLPWNDLEKKKVRNRLATASTLVQIFGPSQVICRIVWIYGIPFFHMWWAGHTTLDLPPSRWIRFQIHPELLDLFYSVSLLVIFAVLLFYWSISVHESPYKSVHFRLQKSHQDQNIKLPTQNYARKLRLRAFHVRRGWTSKRRLVVQVPHVVVKVGRHHPSKTQEGNRKCVRFVGCRAGKNLVLKISIFLREIHDVYYFLKYRWVTEIGYFHWLKISISIRRGQYCGICHKEFMSQLNSDSTFRQSKTWLARWTPGLRWCLCPPLVHFYALSQTREKKLSLVFIRPSTWRKCTLTSVSFLNFFRKLVTSPSAISCHSSI